MNWSPNMLHLH